MPVNVRPSSPNRTDAQRRAASGPASADNGVLLLLAALAAAALLGLPLMSAAPNRLMSGNPIWGVLLLQGPLAWPAAGIACAMLMLSGLIFVVRWRSLRVAALAWALMVTTGLIPGLLWLAGAQAALLAQTGSAVARTTLASGFWVVCGLLALLGVELARKLKAGPVLRGMGALAVIFLLGCLWATGACDELSLVKEFAIRADVFWPALWRHAEIVALSLGFSLCLGLPLGWWGYRQPGLRRVMLAVLNVLQTIPSMALFGLLLAPLAWLVEAVPLMARLGMGGVGVVPAVIALTLYGLLPVVRGVMAGLAQVPIGVLQAAHSMGLSAGQVLRWVQFPLALPVALGGVRTAAVQLVGLAAVAALIGAGGLGALMFEGLFSATQDVVLLGVLPIVAMGVLVDAAFSGCTRLTWMARVAHAARAQAPASRVGGTA